MLIGTHNVLLFLPPANEVRGKVMFLHLCVILFMGVGGSAHPRPQMQTSYGLGRPPWMQTPLGWADPPDADPSRVGQTPPPQDTDPRGWADPLDADPPRVRQTPLDADPPPRVRQTPPGCRPPPPWAWADPPGCRPPLPTGAGQIPPRCRPPSWMQIPPGCRPLPDIWSTSGRYASYYIFTVCKQSCGKVMFLHLYVILFKGGGVHPPRQTHPPGRHPPSPHPERATTADCTHPTGIHTCFT